MSSSPTLYLGAFEQEFASAVQNGQSKGRFSSYAVPPGERFKSRQGMAKTEDLILDRKCTRYRHPRARCHRRPRRIHRSSLHAQRTLCPDPHYVTGNGRFGKRPCQQTPQNSCHSVKNCRDAHEKGQACSSPHSPPSDSFTACSTRHTRSASYNDHDSDGDGCTKAAAAATFPSSVSPLFSPSQSLHVAHPDTLGANTTTVIPSQPSSGSHSE